MTGNVSYRNTGFRMTQTMRWFGPDDAVSLADIKQSGCSGVVTALHHIPNGDVWSREEIQKRKSCVEESGLIWEVVESIPVHETIKTRSAGFELFIENYKQSIRNLAFCGIKVITYNFMPVLDWTRTDLSYEMPDGSKALRFDMTALAAFDICILKREDAEKSYSSAIAALAKEKFESMAASERLLLQQNIIAGLPGSEESFTLRQFQQALDHYKNVDRKTLQQNLVHFLKEIIPVAEQCDIMMALHPDDPPFSIFGLPRVVCNAADLESLFEHVPSVNNGLCFCTGSFGVLPENDLPAMIGQFGERIHFLHLRNIIRNEQGDFYEAAHLDGDADIYAVIKAIVAVMQKRKYSITVRPDHGHQMLNDLQKKNRPGYSVIGRLRGLAEIRGLELGILRNNE